MNWLKIIQSEFWDFFKALIKVTSYKFQFVHSSHRFGFPSNYGGMRRPSTHLPILSTSSSTGNIHEIQTALCTLCKPLLQNYQFFEFLQYTDVSRVHRPLKNLASD